MSAESVVLQPLLSKLAGHASLEEGDRRALSALHCVVRSVDQGSTLFRVGDQAASCFVVLKGLVCRHKVLANGARHILSVHMTGDGIDLHNAWLPTSSHNIQALTPATVALLPARALADLMLLNPAIAQAFLVETLLDSSIQREWTANVGGRDGSTRIAHLFCELGLRLEAAKLGQRHRYDLPMTQEQIADAMGLTPVHVNRVLQGLRAAGLVSREKSPMSIPDWDRLAEAGDFQNDYLHPLRTAA